MPSSLFVGRIPREASVKDLEEIFSKIGKLTRCEIKRDGYGFVDYEDKLDAEDAIKNLHGYELFGGRLVVEHAKGLGNGQGGRAGAGGDSFRRAGPREAMGGCFKCGEPGHYARDCPENGGAARPVYRSAPRRDDRQDDPYRRSYRSPSPRDRSYDRRGYREERSRSRSRSRDRYADSYRQPAYRNDYERSRSRSPRERRDDRYSSRGAY